MTTRVAMQPVFVLHTRPFRETSVIAELLTANYGRVSAVIRSVQGLRARNSGVVRPLVPLLVSWTGKGELLTLTQVESDGLAYQLTGRNLLLALYVNELLIRLLERLDPYPYLFQAYQQLLEQLQASSACDHFVRDFEWVLLCELGYGFSLQQEAVTNEAIGASNDYYFNPEQGFTRCNDLGQAVAAPIIRGEQLLAWCNDAWSEESLHEIQKITWHALDHWLGHKPLKSRELLKEALQPKR